MKANGGRISGSRTTTTKSYSDRGCCVVVVVAAAVAFLSLLLWIEIPGSGCCR